MPAIPSLRLRYLGPPDLDPSGDYVLYWMIAQRRVVWNFALDHAVARARELGKGLVILEALRCDYPWANARLHRFVLEGMADNARQLVGSGVTYYAYLEEKSGDGEGLLATLATRACCVVTDDYPCFFLPAMVAAAARRLPCRLEVVDGNGLLPLRATDRVFGRAVDLRRYLQRELAPHLRENPSPTPLAGPDYPQSRTNTACPQAQTNTAWPPLSEPARLALATAASRWPNRAAELAEGRWPSLDVLPIDHQVAPVPSTPGGSAAAAAKLTQFLHHRLARYIEGRQDLDHRATSELSPYLHFGHLGIHQIFHALAAHQGWTQTRLSGTANGAKEGFWGMSPPAEAFLDEAITWRELGFNFCWQRPDYAQYSSLPDWCRATLARHANDPRPWRYELADLDGARTHDELWNAAQRELRLTGTIHNYLRMLWGKKILEWSATPELALAAMIELNNRYALDGRDPNSYSGIFWCLGRYDRPWAPERPIFGQIRYMSSDNTRRKINVKRYLATFGPLSGV